MSVHGIGQASVDNDLFTIQLHPRSPTSAKIMYEQCRLFCLLRRFVPVDSIVTAVTVVGQWSTPLKRVWSTVKVHSAKAGHSAEWVDMYALSLAKSSSLQLDTQELKWRMNLGLTIAFWLLGKPLASNPAVPVKSWDGWVRGQQTIAHAVNVKTVEQSIKGSGQKLAWSMVKLLKRDGQSLIQVTVVIIESMGVAPPSLMLQ